MSQEEKLRYSKSELVEFEELLTSKMERARKELEVYRKALNRSDDSGTESTTGSRHSLENGSETAEKESLNELAARQSKYIKNLEDAMVRIKNGTYGVCSVSGKLISKERLRAVPHTTQSIEAKRAQS